MKNEQIQLRLSGIDCSKDKDHARQEFKEESDVNTILRRYGAMAEQRAGSYGVETNYDVDLMAAQMTMARARELYHGLKPEYRERYPTWQQFASDLVGGKLEDLTVLSDADDPSGGNVEPSKAVKVTEPAPDDPKPAKSAG